MDGDYHIFMDMFALGTILWFMFGEIQPWTNVRFENTGIILEENRAISMGNYFFTDLDGNEAKVEYTFGYRFYKGELKIDLHHSSIPFNP